MRERLTRACVAGVVLSTLLIPAVGSVAGPEEQRAEARRDLASIQSKIEAHKAEATSLKRSIDSLGKVITELQIDVNKLDAEIARIESEVRTAQASIERTQKEIDQVEHVATKQAVVLYKSGSFDTLDALLDSTSLTELNNRIAMLGVAAEQNTGALVRYHRLKLSIEDQSRELFATKERLEDRLDERSKTLATRNEARDRMAAQLAELDTKLGAEKAKEGHLEADIEGLTQRIQAAQARRAVENLGTSAQGFIWPLNGPITSGYGPRWGRMHTGIDIDGYTGQPIVASKGGSVIMAAPYSAYGNTVIVDHGGGFATLYAHMSSFGVSGGQSVKQGDIVGNVGCTGSCTGDHLHFEVRINGNPVNPTDYMP